MNHRHLYVATDGSDASDGAPRRPWRTIQHGIERLKPGDTLHVRGGTYYERLHVDGGKVSGAEGAMITIRNCGGETVIVDGSRHPGFTEPYKMLLIADASYLRVEGLIFCNNRTAHYGWQDAPEGIHVLATENGPGCRHIEIVNNVVYNIDGETWGYHSYDEESRRHSGGMNAHGIAVYGRGAAPEAAVTNMVIEGNEVYYCMCGASESVVVNGNVDGFRIANNYIHDNDNIGIDVIGGERVSRARALDAARNGVVCGNVVINNTGMANQVYDRGGGANGIYVDGGKDTVIEHNFVAGSNYGCEVGTENLGFELSANVVIRHNVFACNEDTSILLGGTEGAGGIVAERNTAYGDEGAPVCTNEGGNYVIKDNILIASEGRPFWDTYGDASAISFEGNVYFLDGEGGAQAPAGDASGAVAEGMPVADAPGGDFTPAAAYAGKGADIAALKEAVGAELYQKALNNYAARTRALQVLRSVYAILNDPAHKGSKAKPLDAGALGGNIARYFESLPGVAGTGAIVGMKRSGEGAALLDMTDGAFFEPGSPGSYLGQVLCGKGEDGAIVPEATKEDNVIAHMRIYCRLPYTSDGQVHYIDRQVSDVCVRFRVK
ncbi:MAG: right-handed parallel beta-helix repeat-containing protein [Clostridia bacterium]|nr:right-handed parallel beta-helix repeat-containing protein [Clostridia bacterium]